MSCCLCRYYPDFCLTGESPLSEEGHSVKMCLTYVWFGLQRKVSLSTLQSKAAKRREDKKKSPKPPKKKKPKEAKVNGFTSDKMKDSQTLINSEHIELEPIEVTLARQVISMFILHAAWKRSCHRLLTTFILFPLFSLMWSCYLFTRMFSIILVAIIIYRRGAMI